MPNLSPLIPAVLDALERDGYCFLPGAAEPAVVTSLAKEARSRWSEGAFHQARVGRLAEAARRTEIRGDHVLWLESDDPHEGLRDYLEFLTELRIAANEAFFLGLAEEEAHLALYPAGSFYGRHSDCFRGTDRRRVTVLLYLNDAWTEADGGILRVYLDGEREGGHLDVVPRGGTLAVFLSDRFEHEVLPALRERLSVTAWLCRRRQAGF